MVLCGLKGSNLLHHGLLHRLQGNLCSGTWSTSSPSFLADLGVYRVVYLTFFSLLFPTAAVQRFLPCLNYVIAEAPPVSLMGSALASGGSVLEPAGTGSVQHGEPGFFCPKPPLQPCCYQNIAT